MYMDVSELTPHGSPGSSPYTQTSTEYSVFRSIISYIVVRAYRQSRSVTAAVAEDDMSRAFLHSCSGNGRNSDRAADPVVHVGVRAGGTTLTY